MTWATFMTLLASGTALLLSTGALLVAVHSWRRYRSSSSAKLSEQLTDLTASLESQSVELRLIRARLNQRAYRERQRQEAPPESTAPIDAEAAAAEIRAELNAQLARKGAQ